MRHRLSTLVLARPRFAESEKSSLYPPRSLGSVGAPGAARVPLGPCPGDQLGAPALPGLAPHRRRGSSPHPGLVEAASLVVPVPVQVDTIAAEAPLAQMAPGARPFLGVLPGETVAMAAQRHIIRLEQGRGRAPHPKSCFLLIGTDVRNPRHALLARECSRNLEGRVTQPT